jgi:hypothetical protein
MDIKNVIRILLTFLGIYLFVYIPLDVLVLNPKPTDFHYQVVGKVKQQFTESTGKYSSETSIASFIRIRYENGDEKTLRITDPYIAESYVEGNTYVETKERLQVLSFGQILCCFISLFICCGIGLIMFMVICEYIFTDKPFAHMFRE